jgi:hypothetical protein
MALKHFAGETTFPSSTVPRYIHFNSNITFRMLFKALLKFPSPAVVVKEFPRGEPNYG